MEASITAHGGGRVDRLAIGSVQQVEGGDLLLVLADSVSAPARTRLPWHERTGSKFVRGPA